MTRTLAAVALPCLVLILAACKPQPAKIQLDGPMPLLKSAGDTVQLKPVVKDDKGNLIKGAKMTFKSLTPTMATVDPEGIVRAVSSGTASVLVQCGDASKTVDVLVQIPKKITIAPDKPWLMLGVTRGFKATVLTDRGTPMIAGEIRWTVSDPELVSVDKRGNLKTLKEGEVTLTAHAAGIKGSTTITIKHEEISDDGTLVQ